jgi:hypothetical protein
MYFEYCRIFLPNESWEVSYHGTADRTVKIISGFIHHLLVEDAIFIEKRRKGLLRYIDYITKHPIIRNDDIIRLFLTEKNVRDILGETHAMPTKRDND